MAGSTSKDQGLMTEINVTPLVDVVLVLLVLMMVTATALANKSISVELPKAKSAAKEDAVRPLVVSVDESGAMYVDTERVDDAALRARARAAAGAGPTASAVLAADGRARHEVVVHALEVLRGEQITRISILVRSEQP
jgi:biopolymer transport protein ExbD